MLLNALNGVGIQELIYYIKKGERVMLNEETVVIHKIQKHLKQSYQDIAVRLQRLGRDPERSCPPKLFSTVDPIGRASRSEGFLRVQ